MRFKPEAGHDANAGLGIARERLNRVKDQFPEISYGDLWTLAGVVAIQELVCWLIVRLLCSFCLFVYLFTFCILFPMETPPQQQQHDTIPSRTRSLKVECCTKHTLCNYVIFHYH
jgi:hypothetical protein